MKRNELLSALMSAALLVWLLTDSSTAVAQLKKKPVVKPAEKPAVTQPGQKPAPVAAPSHESLNFTEINPDLERFKDRVVEVSPGLHMRVGEYVKASSFKTIPRFNRYLTPEFANRYLKAAAQYHEEIVAMGERLKVTRTLRLRTDNPCAIPDEGDDDVSICFSRNAASKNKLTREIKGELKRIRSALQNGKKTPEKFTSPFERRVLGRIDEIVLLDDAALIAYLLNSGDDEKIIVHESTIPFASQLTIDDHTVSPAAASADAIPGAEPSAVNNGRLEFETVRETPMEFLNGATWNRTVEDSFEVTFASSTWFTDRYYARFSYELSLGLGLRFPFEATARSTITHVRDENREVGYPASSLCSGVSRQDAAVHCASQANLQFTGRGINGDAAFYRRAGVPAQSIYDGKEFVFVLTAHAQLYASIPGPNFSQSFNRSIDLSRNYTPPVGAGSDAVLAAASVRGRDVGLALSAGALGVSGWAALNPGIEVHGRNGSVSLPVSAYANTSTIGGSSEVPLRADAWSPVMRVSRRFGNDPTRPWGLVAHSPMYRADIVITPTLGVEIGVEVVYWSWRTVFGPFAIDVLSLSMGNYAFPRHDGTVAEYRHFVSGCQGNDPSCVVSYREDMPPANVAAAVSAGGGFTGNRGDERNVITVFTGDWGDWGRMNKCRPGTFARRFTVRLEPDLRNGDDTALNSVALWCTDGNGGGGNLVVSNPGHYGTWRAFSQSCATQGDFIRSAQLKYEDRLGNDGDDTTANGFKAKCDGDAALTADEGPWGSWKPWQQCPARQAVCGILTRTESIQDDGDDTALNGVKLQCCNLP